MRRKRGDRRGFVLLDGIVGLGLLLVLLAGLSVMLTRHGGAERSMARQRAAMVLAESILTSLQHGQPLPPMEATTVHEVRTLGAEPPVPGTRWVEVRVELRGASAEIIGVALVEGGGR